VAQFSPQPFGKYYLVDKLAVGGMAEVYLARPPQGGTTGPRYLAVKRILPHFSNNAQFIDMFIDEAKISVQLEHENIVPVYDLGKIGETYFLAMEFVAGQDLKNIVNRCRDRGVRLSYEHAAWIVAELLKGLDYAHKKTDRAGKPLGIVHRDISPQNILVGYDGGVKITDFGIAKAESKLDSTQVGTLKGKFGYMAPEQVVAGGPPLDQRADIFAAGIILWELVTGHRLFHGTSEIEILERVRAARFDPPSAFVPDVPRELERIIFKSLMKDRDKRYTTAFDFQVDLSRFLAAFAPQFNQNELAGVMEELFSAEIALAKSKWNVVIGPVIDRSKVEEGAINESTRPDQTRVSDGAIEQTTTRAGTPAPAAMPVSPAAQQTITRATGKTPPPRVDPDARLVAARTQVSAPVPAPAAASLRPEDLFDEGSPFDNGPEKDPTVSRTVTNNEAPAFEESESTALEQVDRTMMVPRMPTPQRAAPAAPAARPSPTPSRQSPTPSRPAPTPGRSAGAQPISAPNPPAPKPVPRAANAPPPPPPPAHLEEFATGTADTDLSGGKRRGSRAGVVVLLGTLLGLAVAGALAFTGAFPNPFAPPVIEVTSNVDGAVSIDGNVVLASGRSGNWRVGEGDRVISVSKPGYETFTRRVSVQRGDRLTIEATLRVPASPTPTASGTPAPPISAMIRVETTPAGAQVFLDGAAKGKSPVTLDGLDPTKAVVLTVVRDGYVTENRTVTPKAGETTPIQITLSADAKGLPTPTPKKRQTPSAVGTPSAAESPEPTETPEVRIDPSKGFFSLDVPGGWGEVYIDGQQVAARTPVVRAPLAQGAHTVRIFNPVLLKEKTFTITIEPGKLVDQKVTLD